MFFADRTKRVANVIHVTDQQKLDWELRNLQTALASAVPLDPFPYLKKGMMVEVRSGPFRGLQGVADSKYRDRLLIQIETLGRAVAIEMPASLLEPI
jgi:transcription antitermination factor NusG